MSFCSSENLFFSRNFFFCLQYNAIRLKSASNWNFQREADNRFKRVFHVENGTTKKSSIDFIFISLFPVVGRSYGYFQCGTIFIATSKEKQNFHLNVVRLWFHFHSIVSVFNGFDLPSLPQSLYPIYSYSLLIHYYILFILFPCHYFIIYLWIS